MGARRVRRHEEHENHERWLVSYADFITLLFAFFTVLYATSAADVKKQEEFERSIKQQFAGLVGFGGGSTTGTLAGPGQNEAGDPNTSTAINITDTFPPAGAGTEEVQQYVRRALDKDMSKSEQSAAGLDLHHDTVGVSIDIAASELFGSGSATLKPESARALDELGKILKESGRRIIIEGHTDDQPIKTEKFPSNWELSAARATKIVRYLVARHKISPSRLTAVAYADQKPKVPNDSDENRAKNRRIEVMIVTNDSAGL